MAKKSRFRDMKGSAKEDMVKRTEESKKRQGGSNKWGDYLVDDFEGDKFVATEGEHLLDVIPYITGKNDPKLAEGERAYTVDVYVHQKVGINEDTVLCPSSNWKKEKCPICEHLAKMQQSKQFSDDELRAMKPKRRSLYNVVCYDNTEQEEKGVQVWEASFHLTENEILPMARNRRSGGYIPFADPDEGKSISFFREGKGAATRYTGYTFLDRDDIISDETLDDAYCLDELLDRKSYTEIEEIFRPTAPEISGSSYRDDGGEEKEEEREYNNSRSRSRGRQRPAEEEEAQEEEKPQRSRRSRQKAESDSPTGDDDDIPFEDGVSEDEPEEDAPEPEEKPTISRRSRRNKS